MVFIERPVCGISTVLEPETLSKALDVVLKGIRDSAFFRVEYHTKGLQRNKTMVVSGQTEEILAILADRGYILKASVAGVHYLYPANDGVKKLDVLKEYCGGKTFKILWVW